MEKASYFQSIISWDTYPTPLTRAPREGQGPSIVYWQIGQVLKVKQGKYKDDMVATLQRHIMTHSYP